MRHHASMSFGRNVAPRGTRWAANLASWLMQSTMRAVRRWDQRAQLRRSLRQRDAR